MKYELLGLGGAMDPSTLAPTINTTWLGEKNLQDIFFLDQCQQDFCENETQFEFFLVTIFKITGVDFALPSKWRLFELWQQKFPKNNTKKNFQIQIQMLFFKKENKIKEIFCA